MVKRRGKEGKGRERKERERKGKKGKVKERKESKGKGRKGKLRERKGGEWNGREGKAKEGEGFLPFSSFSPLPFLPFPSLHLFFALPLLCFPHVNILNFLFVKLKITMYRYSYKFTKNQHAVQHDLVDAMFHNFFSLSIFCTLGRGTIVR